MSNSNHKIGIIGTGYVGLVTGACFADKENSVICFDVDQKRLDKLSTGLVPFFEPGLSEKVKKNYSNGSLKFSLPNKKLINDVDIIFVCVGTPNDGSGKTDLSQLNSFIDFFLENVTSEKILVLRSTIPVGTCSNLRKRLDAESSLNHMICSNPEFTKEGDAIYDFENPDRVIIGIPPSEELKQKFISLYKPFTSKEKIIFMSTESSELTKYASNAFLATKVSFINDMARFADKTEANINDISLGMGLDPRIGSSFLNAGIGYGGSCFPKDTISLVNQALSYGESLNVLEGTVKTNNHQIRYFHDLILNYFIKNNLKKCITILGLSFKPNTDDVRESRGILLHKMLTDSGFDIKSFDPMILNSLDISIEYTNNLTDALKSSNALVIAVEDDEYKKIDPELLKKNGIKVIFDGRNLLEEKDKKMKGIDYIGIGVDKNLSD